MGHKLNKILKNTNSNHFIWLTDSAVLWRVGSSPAHGVNHDDEIGRRGGHKKRYFESPLWKGIIVGETPAEN